jgi:hypothetical protein
MIETTSGRAHPRRRFEKSLRLTLAALALAPASLGLAETGSTDLCRAVAERLAKDEPSPIIWPVPRLASLPDPVLSIDQGAYPDFASDTEREATRAAWAKRFAGDAELARTFKERFASDAFVLRRLGATNVRALENDQGTMHCTDQMFFSQTKGKIQPVPPPPQYQSLLDSQPVALCNTDIPWLGVVAGTPAFIEQAWRSTDYDYDISIAAWRQGRWSKPCRLSIRYAHVYSLSGVDCGLGKAACHALDDAAPKLAEQQQRRLADEKTREATDFTWSPVAPGDRDRITTLARLVGPRSASAPPATRKEDQQTAEALGFDRMSFPLNLDGRLYLGVIGRQTIGWREFPGFVLVVYDLEHGALKSVASLAIDSQQGRRAQLKLKP